METKLNLGLMVGIAVGWALWGNAQEAREAARMSRVEGGLLPAIVARGDIGKAETIGERMRHHGVPGVSVAVIDAGQVQWAQGYGVIERGGQARIGPTTLFQAGAVSKAIASLTAMTLVEEGRLGLDEDINPHLNSWKVPENRFTAKSKVTLRGLLSHSAGITVDGFSGYTQEEAAPTLRQVLDGARPARNPGVTVDRTPGTGYRQSGGAYVVLQQLLEDVTGLPWERIVQDRVLGKLEMKSSIYAQPLPRDLSATAACGHQTDGAPLPGRWKTYPELAAAGLWTTPGDLAKFAIALRNAVEGARPGILTAETARLMVTRQFNDAALGVFVRGEAEAERIEYAGRNEGFDSAMVIYRRSGKGAVVMINANNNTGIVAEVLQSIAKAYDWPDYRATRQRGIASVTVETLRSYAGRYRAGDHTFPVMVEGTRLFVNFPGMGRTELFPESEWTFFIASGSLKFRFIRDAGNAVTGLGVGAGGQEQVARRVE